MFLSNYSDYISEILNDNILDSESREWSKGAIMLLQ